MLTIKQGTASIKTHFGIVHVEEGFKICHKVWVHGFAHEGFEDRDPHKALPQLDVCPGLGGRRPTTMELMAPDGQNGQLLITYFPYFIKHISSFNDQYTRYPLLGYAKKAAVRVKLK